MNGNDIEFLMFAMNSVNSPNREEVKAFRENREHLSRLVELTKTHGDELFRVIDQLKGIVK
jgi:hypothetical protein